MLLINKTVMLMVAGIALGFLTGSGKIIPLLVDLFDSCRSFRVESQATIKIHVVDDVLRIKGAHTLIERNNLFEFLNQNLISDHLLDAK